MTSFKTQQPAENLQPLTDAQSGIWFAQLRDPDNPIYKTGEYILINGDINTGYLEQAIKQGIDEVDSLHAKFVTTTEGPRMTIARQPWQVEWKDFSVAEDEKLPMESAISWMKGELRSAVDLENGPLFSMGILKITDNQHIWFLSLHHIAVDGYSMSLIVSRVASIYSQLNKGGRAESTEFADQAALLKEDEDYKNSDKYEKDRNFYLERFNNYTETVNLAGRPTVTSDHILRLKGYLEADVFKDMNQLAKKYHVHWYSILMTGIAAYVHRMTRSKEVILGAPLMGRLGSVAIQTPAMRVNILPVRVQFDEDLSLRNLVKQVNQEFKAVRRHHGYRYEELHRDLNLVKDNRNLFGPLVNIMPFEYEHNFGEARSKAHNLSAGPVDDLSFYCYELNGHLNIDIDANPELYSEEQVSAHQQRLFHFMASFFSIGLSDEKDEARISEVSVLMAGEQEKVIRQWNDTCHPLEPETLTALLQRQARKSPDSTALIFEHSEDEVSELTYSTLLQQVSSCARWMQANGVKKGDRVAVIVPRSIELIVVQQAILYSGAIYVPIDPDYPEGRIRYILESAEPVLTFTHSSLENRIPDEMQVICADRLSSESGLKAGGATEPALLPEAEKAAVRPEDPAYIIYTSGSTGKPKGVIIQHKAIVNRLLWMQDKYRLTPDDRVLQKTPAGFDVSVWEFFWPMITGAGLVVAKPDGHKDPAYLADIIERQKITTLHFVPSMLQVFVRQASPDQCQSLRQVFCSDEALPVELVNEYYDCFDAGLHNLYGPTEAAVDVTWWPCKKGEDQVSVPIGYPVWNTQIYILDEQLQPLPPGVTGDLYISGDQVASGYLGREDLTAERFIPDPFGPPGARMYMSGDLARWRDDGAVEYCGRSDFQVKIRGFRIELEEIEHAIVQHENVAQAVVLAPEFSSGDRRLVAYVSTKDQSDLDTAELQAYVSEPLPEYMVPGYFVQVAEFPVTANGKLDRRALPMPDISGQAGTKGPSNLVEERLCKLFSNLLEIPSVGVDDNFFELGGHSLLAAQLIAYVKEIMGIELSLAAVFESPTVAGIAAKLAGTNDEEALNILLPLRKRDDAPAMFCVHPAGGLSWCYAALTPVIPSHIPLYGVQSGNLGDPDATLPGHMMEMAEEYVAKIRKEQPFGPYHLMGWSIGGMIAHAMAGVLQQQGQEVGLLILLDSYPTEQWQEMNPPGEHQALGALIRMAGIPFDEEAHSSLTRPEVVDILQEAGSSMAHLKSETISSMIEVVVNNNDRVRDPLDYVYKGDMLFFNAIKPEEEAFLDRNGWFNYMEGNINVVEVDCIHRDMMRPDMLKIIGGHIADALEKYDV